MRLHAPAGQHTPVRRQRPRTPERRPSNRGLPRSPGTVARLHLHRDASLSALHLLGCMPLHPAPPAVPPRPPHTG
eukprot:12319370-Alexandrium_andersonii.AAC.1